MSKNTIYPGAILLAGALVSACGGGGSSNENNYSNVPSDRVAITSDNDTVVANQAFDGAAYSLESSEASNLRALNTTSNEGASINIIDFAEEQLSMSFLRMGSTTAKNRVSREVYSLDPEACEVSGTMTTSMDTDSLNTANLNNLDLESLQFNAGDSFTLSFNDCDDGDDLVVNGSMTMTLNTQLDYSDFSQCSVGCEVSTSVSFRNFTLTEQESGSSRAVDGGFTLALMVDQNNVSTTTLSGTSFYLLETGGEATLMTNFEITEVVDASTETTNGSFTLASTELNGSITVVYQDVVKDIFIDNPSSGTVVITGANESTLTVDIVDNTTVTLSLDADGTPGPDAGYPATVSWSEIESPEVDAAL